MAQQTRTIKKQIDDHTDQLIMEKFVEATAPLGKGLSKVLDDLTKVSAHLSAGRQSIDDLKWDLLSMDDQLRLETFLETIGPSFNAYQELTAGRKAAIMSRANEQLRGGRRQ